MNAQELLRDASAELAHARNMLSDAEEVEWEHKIEIQRENEIAAEVMGDLTVEGEHKLQKKLVANKFVHEKLNKDMGDTQHEIGEYMRAFEKIMEATGIAHPLEVVDKYESQMKTRENLEAIISDLSGKLEKVKARRQLIMSESEEIKYAGIVNKHRACIDAAEKDLHELRRSLQKTSAHHSKIENLIAKVVHGTQTLLQRLQGIPQSMLPLGDASSQDAFLNMSTNRLNVSRESLVPSLSFCVSKVRRLADALPSSKQEIDECGMDVIMSQFLTPNNVKVQQRNVRRKSMAVQLERSSSSQRDGSFEDASDDDDNLEGHMVLGDAQARMRLKAENKRLIQFAERKRKKLTRLLNKSITERDLDISERML